TFCDLRDVVEDDDAYPIENPWASLVELALKSNRVDYLYERTAEEFYLYLKRRDDGDGFETSSAEVAEMGRLWRLGLEDAIRGVGDETDAVDEYDDETSDDGVDGETETFFDGEFEGGWRDSDGDEGWRGDETNATAETRAPSVDRVAPEFVFIFEPNETERPETPNDREKGRQSDAAQKKDDNREKRNGETRREPGALLDDIFAGDSFAEEWDAIEGRRDEDGDNESAPRDGERKKNGEKKDPLKKKRAVEATVQALLRVLYKKNGVVGAGEDALKLIAGTCDKVLELVQKEPERDETSELDGLANLGALISERGRKALEGLKQIARSDEEENDDERQALERNAQRLRLAPFAALSAEYPGWNEELRRFDALFDDACVRNEAAEELFKFWRRWRSELDDETVARIHAAYDERLRGRLQGWLRVGGALERTERVLTALKLYGALFLDGETNDGEKK
ncbi:MAG: hypothetical protein IKY61_00920, partial [Thermoguttaceae bacterium]|nr:hypothetical protein [Thermoguttaceae bacterium]